MSTGPRYLFPLSLPVSLGACSTGLNADLTRNSYPSANSNPRKVKFVLRVRRSFFENRSGTVHQKQLVVCNVHIQHTAPFSAS
ncbi:hypothetical protein EV361DRAFT_46568 [Lentinula raphanica]|nr:hypothetical protein EV361DRAFT_46568 [Lentinula raphanica]